MLTAAELQRARLAHLPEPVGSNRRLWVAGAVVLPLILFASFLVNRATPVAPTSSEPYFSASAGTPIPAPQARLAAAIPSSPVSAPFGMTLPSVPIGAAPAKSYAGIAPLRTPTSQPPVAALVSSPVASPPAPVAALPPSLPPVSSATSQVPTPISASAPPPSSVVPAPVAPSNANRGSFGVASGIMSSHLLASSQPKYPEVAKIAHVEGPVILQAVVSRTGKVAAVKVLSGHRFLRKAATKAVRGWRYRPYLLNGRAIDVATIITLDFKLPH